MNPANQFDTIEELFETFSDLVKGCMADLTEADYQRIDAVADEMYKIAQGHPRGDTVMATYLLLFSLCTDWKNMETEHDRPTQ